MHLTDVDVEAFKDKIVWEFKDDSIIEWKCKGKGCTKKVIYRPKPFHHFAFYIADRAKPLCPKPPQDRRASVFEECLDEQKNFRKIVNAALVPAATAVLALILHKFVLPFVFLAAFYVLWSLHTYKKYTETEAPVCIRRVWSSTGWTVAAGNIVPPPVFSYVFAAASSEQNLLLMGSAFFGMLIAWLNTFIIYMLLEPYKPRIGFPKTGAWNESKEYRRFLEDLADAWKMQDMCGGWLPYEHYNKLRALVCRGDLDAAGKVSEGWPLLITAYYLMFHKHDVETAQKVLELLKSRDLDGKEKAALEILEIAREAVEDPPCDDQEALKRYAEKINGVQTHGWASLLKALVVAHLTGDENYKDDVKRAVLWAVEKCHCDNLSICYFAYRILNRIKPLCGRPI